MAAEHVHLVKEAFRAAESKYGKSWHLLSAEIREALVRAEAFNIIARQVDTSESMVRFAAEVVCELGRREEEAS